MSARTHDPANAPSALDVLRSADASQGQHEAQTLGLSILLVDDSTVARVFAARMLEFAGYKVDVVVNGKQAVEAVSRATYDMILMDVHMPEMDGIEATITLRAGGCTLPILALSGTAVPAEFKECLDAGMNGALEKPFTLDAFEQEFGRIRKPTGNSDTSPVR